MDALTRLRLGFLLLGALLLTPLFFVLRAAERRMEAQRRLRHEIVAERIFDEMERELATLLANEDQRPSSAYDAQNTLVSSWSPFVVGYFTSDQASTRVIAAAQLGASRAQRVEHAVAALWRSAEAPRLGTVAKDSAPPIPHEAPVLPAAAAKQDEVLRQLNRARQEAPSRRAPNRDQLNDPLMGL